RSGLRMVRPPFRARRLSGVAFACASLPSIARSNEAASVMPVQNGALVAPVCANAGAEAARQTAKATAKRMLRFFMAMTRIPLRIRTHGRHRSNAWDESTAIDCDRHARPADCPPRQAGVFNRTAHRKRPAAGGGGRVAAA